MKNKDTAVLEKIGVVPSVNVKLNKEGMFAILYCQGKAYLCEPLEVSENKLEKGYPAYYEKFLFERNIYLKMHFKLGSITQMSLKDLSECYIMSSGKLMIETILRSMVSFFYVEYPEEKVVNK